jgi:hypothetical protein
MFLSHKTIERYIDEGSEGMPLSPHLSACVLFALHCHLTELASGWIVAHTRKSRVSSPRSEGATMIVKNILAGKRGAVITVESTVNLAAAAKLD